MCRIRFNNYFYLIDIYIYIPFMVSFFLKFNTVFFLKWETLFTFSLVWNLMNFQVKLNVLAIAKLNSINILNDFFSPRGLFYKVVMGMIPKESYLPY